MIHSTRCEILGDLLPHNVTVQYTNNGAPALSFLLRTFEEQPQLVVNSATQASAPQVTLWEPQANTSELTPTSFSSPVAPRTQDNQTAPSAPQSKLIQYHRCIMLHLSMEQIHTYSQLLTSHQQYTIYVSGRLLPANSVLDQGNYNTALPTGINTPANNSRYRGLSYKKNATFDYQKRNQEQEFVLVVDKLSLLSPELQDQPQQMQAAIKYSNNPCVEATTPAESVVTTAVTTTSVATATVANTTTTEESTVAAKNSKITTKANSTNTKFTPLQNAYPLALSTIEQQALWLALSPTTNSNELMPLPHLSYSHNVTLNRFLHNNNTDNRPTTNSKSV